MVKLIRLLVLLLLLPPALALAQSPQRPGALTISNSLSEIAANGASAQLAARSNLGLGLMALQAPGAVAITGGTISGLTSLGVTGNATIGGTLGVTGNATITGGTLFFTPSAATAVIDPGTKNLLLKAGAGGNTGLVQSFAPFQAVTLNMAPVGVMANGTQPTIRSFGNYSGTQTGGPETAFHLLGAASDNVANAAGGVSALVVTHNFGGAAAQGPRNTVDIQSNFTATSGSLATFGTSFQPLRVTANALANDSGSSPSPRGTMWAGNFVAHLAPAATNFSGSTGIEVDTWSETGSSVRDQFGLMIVQVNNQGSGHAVHGSRSDIGLSLNNQPNTVGWNVGIGIGSPSGIPPITSTGTVMAAVGNALSPSNAGTVDGIFDFSLMTATTYFLKGPASSFVVDGAGNVAGASYKVGATAGLTCAGTPTSSFAATGGIVTHC